jgi:predicted PurR-regulated permease PerM
MPSPLITEQFERYARIAAIAILVLGSFLVLSPFVAAILFSAVVCSSTWPIYAWVRRKFGGRPTPAALVMVLLLVLVVIVPLAVLAAVLTTNSSDLVDLVKRYVDAGPPDPPSWLASLPLVGDHINAYWHRLLENREELAALGRRLLDPLKSLGIALGAILGEGLLQLTLVAFVSFFFYRDGEAIARRLQTAFARLAIGMGPRLLSIVDDTANGVMYGILGTALAQALVAWVGFMIAGVPAAALLAAATFFLSVIPVGPPLAWGGAAAWLFYQDQTGWGIFMVLWGLLVISSVDNFVKPILISRGSNQPIALIFLGVLGGVLAFGFVGIFLGPVILAVTSTLLAHWTGEVQVQQTPAPPPQ